MPWTTFCTRGLACRCAAALAIAIATGSLPVWLLAQGAARPEFAPIVEDPALPRVLLIGDSISIGYTLPLRAALKGRANVHRPAENCQHTWKGLESIDRWLGDGTWDVIHFNWGLHDLKHVDAQGRLALPPSGKQISTVEQYASNLEKLVDRLNATGAKLVWRPTTPVPHGARGRIPSDLDRYNGAAREIMDRHGIEIDDMNAFIAAESVPHVRPDNVHFSAESSARLAENSAAAIAKALAAQGK